LASVHAEAAQKCASAAVLKAASDSN